MRALLDTHILLWWLSDDSRLSATHRAIIGDTGNELLVSSVTVAEIAIKSSLGKLTSPDDLVSVLDAQGFRSLPLTADHADALRTLPWHHRDPFDRMLVAQSAVERVPFLSADARITQYGIDLIA
ncbi:type II toxin-antitoxin system VapC family toxin [Planctomonas sp. JC2975]|uniref:PIN domain-containing protein n=1 Tax=Planctomonas sp. JC2975 TaxID=2729626 RepID=UPI001475229A|nr:type II toxin-antitoxin system VapC family toxin [Planctomonas sp. JC2975]